MIEGYHFSNNNMFLFRVLKQILFFFLTSKYVWVRTDYVCICKTLKEIKLDNMPKVYFILTSDISSLRL